MSPSTKLGPLVKEVTVAVPPARAWTVFTEGIDDWWPVGTHSVGGEGAVVVFEEGVGGRILERWEGGTEHVWGEVQVWEPPRHLRCTWHPGRDASEATELEVWFEQHEDGTRLRLEHRGWERRGAEAAGARASYDSGWDFVLGRYTAT